LLCTRSRKIMASQQSQEQAASPSPSFQPQLAQRSPVLSAPQHAAAGSAAGEEVDSASREIVDLSPAELAMAGGQVPLSPPMCHDNAISSGGQEI